MGHPGICPKHCQYIYLSLFHDIYDVAYGGGSQNNGNPFCKIQWIHDYQGYLVFIVAQESIHLNLDNDVV